MNAAAIRIELRLPGCRSLKEKRRRLRPILDHLRRRLELSAAEVDLHDAWQRSALGVALVDGGAGHLGERVEQLRGWLLAQGDVELVDYEISHLERP
jgi:uncharacterized protein YlxP (DUF503 family)